MRLITKTIAAKIPALYAQDGKGMDAICHLKLFVPWGGETYYITELNPATGEAFGLAVTPVCPEGEMGYFDLNEMQAVRGPLGLGIERDLHFTRKTLRECVAQAA